MKYLYADAEIHLKKDPIMAKIIKANHPLASYSSVDPYEDLISSIISQQLSTKAADTIYSRVIDLVQIKPIKPGSILALSDEELRKCGLSFSKIAYIKGISDAVLKGDLDFEEMREMSDEDAIKKLVEIKGVGRWTAEMFLMHALNRQDIFSVGDLGLRTAVAKHYKVEREDLDVINKISSNWSPYRTIASRYLWKSLG